MSELVFVANAGDGTITTLELHRGARPRLEVRATSGVGPGTGTFAVDPARGLVYAGFKGDPAGIATLTLDPETGALDEIARREVEAPMAYLSLARDGSVLLGASYHGGFGACWPVAADGRIGELADRSDAANAHAFVAHGDRAYLVSLGEDLISQFELGADGTLSPLDPPTVACPPGSGPRHLVVQGPNAYLVTEYSGEAIHFEVSERGTLTRREAVSIVDPAAGLRHSRMGADPAAENLIWGADLHLAGPWLLCSERTASTIATVTINDGSLGEIAAVTPTLKQPRGFAVTAEGQFVIAVGEKATTAALYRIEDDGTLALLDEAGVGAGANWVRIITVAGE